MAIPVNMPQVGQDIEAGKIVEWHVQENDPVRSGDIIATVESEKADFDVEAEEDGVLIKQLYQEGEEAPVLKPIAYIGASGEAVPEVKEEKVEKDGIIASPSAKRIAKETRTDLSAVQGSGPGGRIIKRDLSDASTQPSGDKVVPFSRMRKKIAEKLVQSKQTIPHFYLFTDVDMTKAIVWRKGYNEKHNSKVTVTDLIIKTAATALCDFPDMNAHVHEDKIIIRSNINIGTAVSVEDGLLVPVIPDADKKNIDEISMHAWRNAESARKGKVDPGNIGSFTISNLGMNPITRFVPIINPPECAILGIGQSQKKIVPIGDDIGIRDMLTICIACDHRAVDGAYAARFLEKMKEYLENFK